MVDAEALFIFWRELSRERERDVYYSVSKKQPFRKLRIANIVNVIMHFTSSFSSVLLVHLNTFHLFKVRRVKAEAFCY